MSARYPGVTTWRSARSAEFWRESTCIIESPRETTIAHGKRTPLSGAPASTASAPRTPGTARTAERACSVIARPRCIAASWSAGVALRGPGVVMPSASTCR